MRLFLVALCALILGSMQVLAACAGRSGEAASDGGDGDVLLPGCQRTCAGGVVCCDAGYCVLSPSCVLYEYPEAGSLSDCFRCVVEDNHFLSCLGVCCGDVDHAAPECITACGSSCSSACNGCAKTVLGGAEEFCGSAIPCFEDCS
jgi:hypothetical protein